MKLFFDKLRKSTKKTLIFINFILSFGLVVFAYISKNNIVKISLGLFSLLILALLFFMLVWYFMYIDKFNQKYEGLAKAEIEFEIHLLPFERVDDDRVEKAFAKGAQKTGVDFEISSFHAGAETHIYCQKQNKNSEIFAPFLLGLADIYNMHSAEEKVDYKTIIDGYHILQKTFLYYNA